MVGSLVLVVLLLKQETSQEIPTQLRESPQKRLSTLTTTAGGFQNARKAALISFLLQNNTALSFITHRQYPESI